MKTTLYLQFILTVIAINLTLLTLKEMDIIPMATAAETPTVRSGTQDITDVNIVSIGGMRMYGSNLPIVIKDIETTDKLPVEIKGWQTSDRPQIEVKAWSSYDKIPVEVKNNYVYVKQY